MLKKIVVIVILLLCGSNQAYAKEHPDDIKAKLKNLRNSENFTKESISHINLLVDLGNALKYSKTDTVKFLAVESLELSRLINYKKGEFESLLNFGYYELFNGNLDKASYYYNQSLDGALANGLYNLAVKSYNGIAASHFTKAEYPDAFTNFQNALELAEQIDDSEMAIKMSSNLGTLFSILEDYDEALKFYTLAQSKFTEDTTIITRLSVLVNLGYLYNKINEPVRAISYLDESIDLLQEVQADKILAFAYLTKGEVYNQIGSYKEALSIFNKANTIYKKVNDKKGEADLYYYSGISHTKLNNDINAEEAFLKSLALYQSFNLKSGLERSYRALYSINKDKGITPKALSYLELAQKYSDSVSKEKQLSTISMMNAKLSYEKNKARLTEQNEIELNDRKKYIAWIIIGIISSVLISILLFRAATTKKRLNQELATQTTILAKKQEELNMINANQDKLFSIVGHDLRGPIVSLKNLLGSSLEKNNEIKHFYTFGPKLKKDVDHIHFTLDNLLNWGLTQMKGNITKKEGIFVKEQLLEVIQFFSEDLDKKRLTLKLVVPETLKLNVDANHFSVIFRNLISNAIKFTPENESIFIDTNTEGNNITINVKDTGTGIPIEILTKIFDNMEHVTTMGTNNERGSGLGLSLCKELVEKNNGFISVESELGKGSIFTVHFT